MIKGIQTTGSALKPIMTRLEVIANNLANINTTGFKKDTVFLQMMNDTGLEQAKTQGDSTGYDTRRYTDFSEGSPRNTGNPLDLMIQGRGFFVVDAGDGVTYTRNGNFALSADGTVTTHDGRPVMGVGGPLRLPDLQKDAAGTVAISETGELIVDKHVVGRLRIVDLTDATQFEKRGDAFIAPRQPGLVRDVEEGAYMVRQGYLEESNVDGLDELVQMIELTRTFESGQRAIQQQDATLDKSMDIGRY